MRVPLVRDGLGRQANAASASITAIGKAETFERGRDLAAGWACFRVSSPVAAARLMFLRRERCPEKPSGWARSLNSLHGFLQYHRGLPCGRLLLS